MDFSWSEEQRTFKDAVVNFAAKELNDDLIERDRNGELARENWRKCGRFGILGLPYPEKYGGSDADILTTMLTMEGLGYACRDNGLIFAMNAQMWSVMMPIFTHGTDAQKEKYLPQQRLNSEVRPVDQFFSGNALILFQEESLRVLQ